MPVSVLLISFYLFRDEILLCLLVAAFIAEMILQFRKVSAIKGKRPAIASTIYLLFILQSTWTSRDFSLLVKDLHSVFDIRGFYI